MLASNCTNMELKPLLQAAAMRRQGSSNCTNMELKHTSLCCRNCYLPVLLIAPIWN